MSQEVRFMAPVKFGDTITAIVEVAEIMVDKRQARLKTYCVNQESTTVLEGEALVSPPRAPKK
jgi:3-hydroxybutyryl-CoA dehydratase